MFVVQTICSFRVLFALPALRGFLGNMHSITTAYLKSLRFFFHECCRWFWKWFRKWFIFFFPRYGYKQRPKGLILKILTVGTWLAQSSLHQLCQCPQWLAVLCIADWDSLHIGLLWPGVCCLLKGSLILTGIFWGAWSLCIAGLCREQGAEAQGIRLSDGCSACWKNASKIRRLALPPS